MEGERDLKINSKLTTSQMRQLSGRCQVTLTRVNVRRFERRRSNQVRTAAVASAPGIVKVERDAPQGGRSSARKIHPRIPGPSCSTAATVGSLNAVDIKPRIKVEGSPGTVGTPPKKKFACGRCEKRFLHKGSLKRHVQSVHRKARPFPCHVCGKAFFRQWSLQIHLRCHTGERPFKCQVCKKRFITAANLYGHKAIHLPETLRPFKCTLCPRAFYKKLILTHHLNRHTGNKPYKCGSCSKGFCAASGLWHHCKTSGHRAAAGSQGRRVPASAVVFKREQD